MNIIKQEITISTWDKPHKIFIPLPGKKEYKKILKINSEEGGSRKFICVQLAEPCDTKSEAYKAGFKTIGTDMV